MLFVEPTPNLPDRTWLGQLFAEVEISDEQRKNILAGKPGSGVADCGPIVCACFGVGENTLKEAIKNGDAQTVEQIGAVLKAGTNCGSCIPELQSIISALKK